MCHCFAEAVQRSVPCATAWQGRAATKGQRGLPPSVGWFV